MREKIIEKYLVREVKKIGGLCLKWVSPGMSGVPDRIVLMPEYLGDNSIVPAQVIFIEIKSPHGKLSPLQKETLKELDGMGFKPIVLYTCEQIDSFINGLKAKRSYLKQMMKNDLFTA